MSRQELERFLTDEGREKIRLFFLEADESDDDDSDAGKDPWGSPGDAREEGTMMAAQALAWDDIASYASGDYTIVISRSRAIGFPLSPVHRARTTMEGVDVHIYASAPEDALCALLNELDAIALQDLLALAGVDEGPGE